MLLWIMYWSDISETNGGRIGFIFYFIFCVLNFLLIYFIVLLEDEQKVSLGEFDKCLIIYNLSPNIWIILC